MHGDFAEIFNDLVTALGPLLGVEDVFLGRRVAALDAALGTRDRRTPTLLTRSFAYSGRPMKRLLGSGPRPAAGSPGRAGAQGGHELQGVAPCCGRGSGAALAFTG